MVNPFYVHQVLNNPKYTKSTVDPPPNKKSNRKQATECPFCGSEQVSNNICPECGGTINLPSEG